MSSNPIATALTRVRAVLRRRPGAALSEDAPAHAVWRGATRVETDHPGGWRVTTDMPAELGGSGDQVSPGWLLRAGAASCTATAIALVAAERGVALTQLEVDCGSRSDARALIGVEEADGRAVFGGPLESWTRVRIAAQEVASDTLRALVDEGYRRSPVVAALQAALPLALHVEIIDDDRVAAPRRTPSAC